MCAGCLYQGAALPLGLLALRNCRVILLRFALRVHLQLGRKRGAFGAHMVSNGSIVTIAISLDFNSIVGTVVVCLSAPISGSIVRSCDSLNRLPKRSFSTIQRGTGCSVSYVDSLSCKSVGWWSEPTALTRVLMVSGFVTRLIRRSIRLSMLVVAKVGAQGLVVRMLCRFAHSLMAVPCL